MVEALAVVQKNENGEKDEKKKTGAVASKSNADTSCFERLGPPIFQ